MDLTDMSEAEIEQYQTDLRRCHADLVAAAAAGKFNRAGKVFSRLLSLQAAAGAIPDRADLDAVKMELAELDRVPGFIAGLH